MLIIKENICCIVDCLKGLFDGLHCVHSWYGDWYFWSVVDIVFTVGMVIGGHCVHSWYGDWYF